MNPIWEKYIKAMPAPPAWRIDWEGLSACGLENLFQKMALTMQNPVWHGEGDVMTHTRMVCESLAGMEGFRSLPERSRQEVFLAAVLHDMGKIVCTRLEEGRWTSPNHGRTGAKMARELLWKEWGMAGEPQLQQFRECVCLLIRYHMLPCHILRQEDGERMLVRAASWGELVPDFTLSLLHLLAEADIRGRICDDEEERLEETELGRQMAEEAGCLDGPLRFPSSVTRKGYLQGMKIWKEQELYDDSWGEVIMLCGLPGTGKDTWISRNRNDRPCISLDEIRRVRKISPGDDQGPVIAEAREMAREYLRNRQSFVWNATCLNPMTRERQIRLFEQYHARVRIVFLETSWETGLSRNRERSRQVAETVIAGMLSRMEPPGLDEAGVVEWHCV